MKQRTTDPTKLMVQLNVKVPFDFREHLFEEATKQHVTVSDLVRGCLEKRFMPDMLKKQTVQS